ncbi:MULTISPECIES: hypothetical protein [Micromonospora]|uniref:Uncharacterized protein n=1 Tax=Micromonospora solifontis TaxID=2487138 RepID=A0ABX9WDV7_9ACTN|nr:MULTISPECIES: hypothetical protein [Micromonospora]NES16771.1 hypothetical protein [Micromonospora sp. PPF5-17B]NES37738.1 hypothetical protein [Micromonospora solifontis]NES58880.1 hypothetical protein [Micromonospora sp. PPF5-6]RNL98001.1 hypothetical protein EFE23_16505 [Micromonospora solifontis]
MAEVAIEFVGGDPGINSDLEKRLSASGIQTITVDAGVGVRVDGVADSDRIGAVLSSFIGERTDSFKLRLDGPGEEALIHEVRVVADPATLAAFLRAAAYLL